MHNDIPGKILGIYKQFKKSGFEIYFVGGCVRDFILKKAVKDWDFTTNATPEEILKLFPDGFYDNQFGTVGIPIEENNKQAMHAGSHREAGRQVVEVTTYRTEHGYIDRRHPQKVSWGKTIEEDLSRRILL